MKRERISVNFAYECGDRSLPHLKDLVRDVPDKEKSKILAYLKENCILACPGIIRDFLNPNHIIGFGNIYTDGKYYWRDDLIGYIDKYNIVIPEEFRCFIIQNYSKRMERHALLKTISLVEIENNSEPGYSYSVKINRNGIYEYKNNTGCKKNVMGKISAENAQYIIDPIMSDFFCYDSDNHGSCGIDGYHWQIKFFKNKEFVYETEGWINEDRWRYKKFVGILEYIEKFIPHELGTNYMDYDV
ncbi:MAG: hypothetical protein LUF34_07055 [Lachnospiraceae bacterium]|nr:hypothetical protein [Lachnospiraceae bacterium]